MEKKKSWKGYAGEGGEGWLGRAHIKQTSEGEEGVGYGNI